MRSNGIVAGAAAVLTVLLASPATAAGGPPNTPPRGLHRCSMSGTASPGCLAGALEDFKRARAREGLGPMTLPSDFASLAAPAQLMVLADLDRVDRGLAPVAGVSRALQPYAQAGARERRDPDFPGWTQEGGGNWASTASSLWSEYLWMYDDGPGAGNLDCRKASSAGCYGHRRNVLAHYHGRILMGAGSDRSGGATQLFLGRDDHDHADMASWSAERSRIPVGVSRHRLARSGRLRVWASGRSMRVRATASHGWHVSRRVCSLRAGHTCTLIVKGAGRGTLRLTGPTGPVTVALGR